MLVSSDGWFSCDGVPIAMGFLSPGGSIALILTKIDLKLAIGFHAGAGRFAAATLGLHKIVTRDPT